MLALEKLRLAARLKLIFMNSQEKYEQIKKKKHVRRLSRSPEREVILVLKNLLSTKTGNAICKFNMVNSVS